MTAHLKEPSTCAPSMEQGHLGHEEAEGNRAIPFALAEGAAALLGPVSTSHVRRYLADMTRAPQHVGHQRRSVAVLLGSWGVAGEPRDSVLVAISELLSNAVLYGISGTVGLCVAYDSFSGKAHIAVNDRTPGRQAERCRPDDDQEGGRGLLLVDALADVWGVSEDGCTTWCSIDVSSGDSQ